MSDFPVSQDDYEAQQLLDEISRFDAEYVPDAGRRPGLDSLPDGDYDFEIMEATFGKTEQTREAILRLALAVRSGASSGLVLERIYLFQRQEDVNRLGADLVSLALPADRWTFSHGARFGEQLVAHLPTLRGVRFRGKKGSYPKRDNKGTGHSLMIFARLPAKGTPMAPPPARPLPTPAPAGAPAGNGPAARAATDDPDDPPF